MTLTHVLNSPIDFLDGGNRSVAAPRSEAKPRPDEGTGFLVGWWLIQGLTLGALGGGAVSAVVVGSVLGLRHLLGA